MTLPSIELPSEAGWRRAGQRTLHVLGMALLLLVVVPFVVYGVPQLVGAEQSYVVLSGSMEPSLSPGDVVFVYGAAPTAIDRGDVITFRTDGSSAPITHRVVDVVPTNDFPSGVAFRTKGDANEDRDAALLPGGRVVGRVPTLSLPWVGDVLVRLPYMGYVITFANTTLGFVLLIVLPVSLFVVNEGRNLVRTAANRSRSSAAESTAAERPDAAERTDAAEQTRAADDSDAERPPDPRIVIGATPDTGITLSARTLTLVAAAFAIATLAAGRAAYLDANAWTVGATVAAFGGLVFALSLRQTAMKPLPDATADAEARRIVRASLPAELTNRPQVRVASRAALLEYADVVDRLVIEDDETGAYYLPDGDILYAHVEASDEGNEEHRTRSDGHAVENAGDPAIGDANRSDVENAGDSAAEPEAEATAESPIAIESGETLASDIIGRGANTAGTEPTDEP